MIEGTELEPQAKATTIAATSHGMTRSRGRRRRAAKARARIVAPMTYPERIVPDETSSGVLALHLARYRFAARWCDGRDVLDLGCGVGYGTAALADTSRSVVGGDVDDNAIAYARGRYTRS